MIEVIIVFLCSLLIRLLPLRFSLIDYDTYGHVYLASEVAKQKKSPWGDIYLQCWESDKYRLPYLWHWFVGRIPINWLLSNMKWMNGIIDAVFATLIYLIFLQIFNETASAMIGVFLYLLTPMWFSSISIGTRVSSFTPRLISEILLNLILLFIFFDLGMPYWLQFSFAIIATISVLLSSKFGLQAVIFIFPLIFFFTGKLDLILLILISFLLLVILSEGEATNMLRRQFHHLAEYYRNNRLKPNATSKRNQISNLFVKTDQNKFDYYQIVWNLLATNSYTCVLFKMPIYICVMLLIFYQYFVYGIDWNQNIYSPILASTILFLLINRPNLLFLGEAERYLNHICIFIIIVAIKICNDLGLNWILFSAIGYGLVYWIFECNIIHRLTAKHERALADEEIQNYLLNFKNKKLINSFPYHNFSLYRVMLTTMHDVIMPVHIKNSIREDFKNDYEIRYGYLDLNKLDEIHEYTSLDILIVDKKALIAEGFGGWKPSSLWKEVDLNQSIYDIYELT